MAHGQAGAEICFDHGPTLSCNHEAPIVAFDALSGGDMAGQSSVNVAVTLHGGGKHGARMAIAFDCKGTGVQTIEDGSSPTLRAMGHGERHANAGGQLAIAIQERAVCEIPAAGPDGKGWRDDGAAYTLEARTVTQVVAFQDRVRGDDGRGYDRAPAASVEVCGTLETVKRHNIAIPDVAHKLRAEGFDASEDGSGRGAPLVPLSAPWAVRRLTPRECERLQGFPDDYTLVPVGNKFAADGPRYKALGNSMAVNVMEWIGHRIDMLEGLDL